MKGNIHKKLYPEDKFGRRFYCQHARLGLIRMEKKAERTEERRFQKRECKEQEEKKNDN